MSCTHCRRALWSIRAQGEGHCFVIYTKIKGIGTSNCGLVGSTAPSHIFYIYIYWPNTFIVKEKGVKQFGECSLQRSSEFRITERNRLSRWILITESLENFLICKSSELSTNQNSLRAFRSLIHCSSLSVSRSHDNF